MTCEDDNDELMDDLKQILMNFQDYLAPRLDTYEQAIYLYLFRLTWLVGTEETIVGFKSARRRMACGVGEKGKPMSEQTAYEKLRSLQQKGCITIVDSTRDGRRIRIHLPAEIPGVIPAPATLTTIDLEMEDFFENPANRERILTRENYHCFYCLRRLTKDNYVIEHVISRPVGNNGYRNVVAACRECNNRKNSSAAGDWLRALYREGFLDAATFQDRKASLDRLQAGELKPLSSDATPAAPPPSRAPA